MVNPNDQRRHPVGRTCRTEPSRPIIIAARLAAMLLGGIALNGCVAILPTIPQNVPGYGQAYCVVDEKGETGPSGLLLLVSTYKCVGQDSFGCFPIEHGRVEVPAKTDVRYDYVTGGLIFLPLVYVGWFQNPSFTGFLPLVPGYVPIASAKYPRFGATPSTAGEIRVMAADAASEEDYLVRVWFDYLQIQYHLKEDEGSQWERARNYVIDRFQELSKVQAYVLPYKWRGLSLPSREVPGS